MSEENVELVRRFLAAWTEVDQGLAEPEGLTEFSAPDAPFYPADAAEAIRGVHEFLKFRADWLKAYDDWSYGADKIMDAGADHVVVTFHQRGRLRGTDSWVDMHYGIVYMVEEGMITEARFYTTAQEALEAAGP